MDVAIRKIGQHDGQDRFVLVDVKTRRIVTTRDASAAAIKRFFVQRGVADGLVEKYLQLAHNQYAAAHKPPRPSVDDAADTIEDDNLLFELGLDDTEDSTEDSSE